MFLNILHINHIGVYKLFRVVGETQNVQKLGIFKPYIWKILSFAKNPKIIIP